MNPTRTIQQAVTIVGDFMIFVGQALGGLVALWTRRGLILYQCEFIGVNSTGIVTVSAIFLGAVLGYQLYQGFHVFGAEALLGGSVGVALYRDLAAVMASFMVTGRCGASFTHHFESGLE